MKTASVLVVLALGMSASSLAGEGGDEGMEAVFSEQDVSCSQYCGATYPEHTYPDSEDYSACTRGCRLAIMDALIAWPFEPDTASCLATCREAYDNGLHCFACKLGCNATTIDQKIPNRDKIYQTDADHSTAAQVGFVVEVFATVRDQLPQFIMIGDNNMADLTEHAEKMYQLLPCNNAATFIFIEDDGESVDIRYGYDFVEGSPNDESVDGGDDKFYTSTYRFSCPWQYAMAGRVLFLLGVGLVAVALVSCCCASLMPEEEDKKREHYTPMKASRKEFYTSAHLKSPVIFSPGYPQPVPYYGKKSTQF